MRTLVRVSATRVNVTMLMSVGRRKTKVDEGTIKRTYLIIVLRRRAPQKWILGLASSHDLEKILGRKLHMEKRHWIAGNAS